MKSRYEGAVIELESSGNRISVLEGYVTDADESISKLQTELQHKRDLIEEMRKDGDGVAEEIEEMLEDG